MQILVPTEARELTVTQIMELPTLLPPERLMALWERSTELKRRRGCGLPSAALLAELRGVEDALFAYGNVVMDWNAERE